MKFVFSLANLFLTLLRYYQSGSGAGFSSRIRFDCMFEHCLAAVSEQFCNLILNSIDTISLWISNSPIIDTLWIDTTAKLFKELLIFVKVQLDVTCTSCRKCRSFHSLVIVHFLFSYMVLLLAIYCCLRRWNYFLTLRRLNGIEFGSISFQRIHQLFVYTYAIMMAMHDYHLIGLSFDGHPTEFIFADEIVKYWMLKRELDREMWRFQLRQKIISNYLNINAFFKSQLPSYFPG